MYQVIFANKRGFENCVFVESKEIAEEILSKVQSESQDNSDFTFWIHEISAFDTVWNSKYKDDKNLCPFCNKPMQLTDDIYCDQGKEIHFKCWTRTMCETIK